MCVGGGGGGQRETPAPSTNETRKSYDPTHFKGGNKQAGTSRPAVRDTTRAAV